MSEPLTSQAPRPPEAVTAPPVDLGGLAELDQRIHEAERRLIAREDGLHRRVRRLRQRARGEPRRLLGPVAAALATLFGLFWLRRSRRRPSAHARGTPAQTHSAAWTHCVGLAWPLLPAWWRSRLSPAAAITLVSLVAPLLARLFRVR
ncbi:MAG: hypothetical protein A2W72_05320 [Burkholderiales bacterium RIFCSPLOWO2_12_67_14]|nr:MAG: hypothetical protein A3I64_06260 [Burkholderiales bacterium RIFCSPLOWO2_02_FULL_67_64]OGB42012.1 MAG: hypothetical protein A2W72_05320 [Burkholderiales bacterium RIFCSPLOWO2_12_67_14]OGB44457.1 MAG: hypothetical protein A3E51_20595 [Burkholderiales bacterium RIFCSPHIGHO2_12_FULL_67_38]OGB77429.1 MAG: hypothetical protein A3G82_18595 [Burkholderiales bacterium RIFCSPLOWO2_12_FULL_67_210]